MRATLADAERRLERLRAQLEGGSAASDPSLERATEDLGVALEELHVTLEELDTTNEELGAAKLNAELEGRRYRELFQLIPAACLVTDPKGVIVEANRAAGSLLGHSTQQLTGKPLSVFVVGDDQARYFELLDRLKVGGPEVLEEEELRFRSATDRRFTAGVTAVPERDAHRVTIGGKWLVRDLTIQIRRERERRGRSDREAYRHVAGGVIHHLNNLLASIRGYSEILEKLPGIEARGLRAAHQIQAGTERGERLTRQLLAFARAGSQQLEPRSINTVVEEICEMAVQMVPSGTQLFRQLSPKAGTASMDVLSVYQAVLNLIFNSRDALEGGGEIRVATSSAELDEETAAALEIRPGRYVTVTVTDSGSGMDAETRARALEPFFSTKAIGSGFGLGLSTADAIVREAGGALDIRSQVDAGTEVTLYFPATESLE
jgi:PAS domain S-box-containing protein